MKILSFDTETTWTQPVNPLVARITEIGAVLMDWPTKTPVSMLSQMIWEDEYPQSPPELVELTGLTDEFRKEHGVPLKEGLIQLNLLFVAADYIVAHNGNEFDKPIYLAECERVGISAVEKPWLDTKVDIAYPKKIKTTKLAYLCAEHGFVNPFAHRAVFDALSVVKVLEQYDIREVIELSKQETVRVVASVSFENKHQARDRGYYWNPDARHWFKNMKESQVAQEQEAAPFTTTVLRST